MFVFKILNLLYELFLEIFKILFVPLIGVVIIAEISNLIGYVAIATLCLIGIVFFIFIKGK